MYDVAIIGAGISGCSLAYELSKYDVNVVLIEKENDVSVGTTKANSGIIHGGYDPIPGSKMAKYNTLGNVYTKELCKQLDVPMKEIGALVLGFNDSDLRTLNILKQRGIDNGIDCLKILSKEEVFEMEPNISKEVIGALYSPNAAIVSPWELALALAETAVLNGVKVQLNTQVTGIDHKDTYYEIQTNNGPICSKYVCNAAGVFADQVSEMIGNKTYKINPNKGEYYLLDKSQGTLVNHVIFQCPNENGKGILVSPTVHGNLIVGPDSQPSSVFDTSTTSSGLQFVKETAFKSVPNINFRESIRNFAGIRAKANVSDFIIKEDETNKGFFHIAGMQSPGLTSACAISLDVVKMLNEAGLPLTEKEHVVTTRKVKRFESADTKTRIQYIKENPLYGKIICRCETVTEGEIIDAIHRPIPATSIDAVKRRINSGMGRCQGGFCGPRVQEIIARELNIPLKDVPQDRLGTNIIIEETKKEG